MRCVAFVVVSCLLFFSCDRSAEKGVTPAATDQTAAKPSAIVQAGEYPLWFQCTAEGPILIETIEDACFSAALVPWPLAPHVRFMLAQEDSLVMAVNREGIMYLAPRENAHIGLHRFSGGTFWRQYTVVAFFLFDQKPVALLYRDDRFLDSGAPLPSPRLWTFDLHSTGLQSLAIPPLDKFAPKDDWDIDSLRQGGDGYWYFRAMRKRESQPELRMLRSDDLVREGEQISLGAFQNAALPKPLSAAPGPLKEILAAIFTETGCTLAVVNSPAFQTARPFATANTSADENGENAVIAGFYAERSGKAFLLAVLPRGNALYAQTGAAIKRFSLPALPEGFFYTGIGLCGDTVIASWEEQDEYSIGAAGFMALRITEVIRP
jgi:hypothetical protein